MLILPDMTLHQKACGIAVLRYFRLVVLVDQYADVQCFAFYAQSDVL